MAEVKAVIMQMPGRKLKDTTVLRIKAHIQSMCLLGLSLALSFLPPFPSFLQNETSKGGKANPVVTARSLESSQAGTWTSQVCKTKAGISLCPAGLKGI